MLDHRVLNAKRILADLITQISSSVEGIERLTIIGQLIDKQPEEIRHQLRLAVEFFLLTMESKEASDLDFGSVGSNGMVWYRIYGKKAPDPEMGNFTVDETDLLLLNLLMQVERQDLWNRRQLDFSYQLPGPTGRKRFRATMYLELNHLAMNLRRINTEVRPFSGLGLHRNVARLMSLEYEKRGLILITGITGSGKSATLDTIIDANNRHSQGHIVVIADPLEYIHTSNKCAIRHREVGRDVPSFKEGTIQALRQDPDIIVIGEMRDPDTIATVLEAADSGHKVFTTLHTSSAVESIDRILGESMPLEQTRIRERLASVLTCVISQKLVPTLNGKLVLAKEVMVANVPVRAAIRNNHTDEIYQIIQQCSNEGMITMEQDLARLHKNNTISYEQALNNANNKKRFEDLVKYERRLVQV
ncbi:MAG: ATPase, T2SS/T4P/T4SS family [candidate division KSB1 bacterium]|nr:ATPase, T2SS/T4P/T4SS family [candidate division KSB1 bacterium]MDZ7300896.1 ATPase, T2SS/T4P/T4SS family [candidate division KSB1 bacterium]MDZ7309834.1 ATPase, T2SS/T4P/T4SS family [candidate division KSB1 bacterium]